MQALFEKIFGSYNQKQIAKYEKNVAEINKIYDTKFQNMSADDVRAYFVEAKKILSADPEKLEKMTFEVFAGIKAAAANLNGYEYEVRGKKETWMMTPYDVQLLGGLVLHNGGLSEMKTGEGKTLVCTIPVILNALTGKGVHVVTVNDYLAQRDAEWMWPLYEFCGLSLGVIVSGIDIATRKSAYESDITYGTNNEFGFDYLRDNMAQNPERIVQRPLNFAIVDEVDSILIDEARTPLIISAPSEESIEKYLDYAQIVKGLVENEDYNIDLKQKSATLSESGVLRVEEKLGIGNIFTDRGFEAVHHLESALKAEFIMHRDQDYVVSEDGRIVIVDEFTGRLMPGRRFSDGLHQALEAKESVEIQRASKTLATVTFQNYFRLYDKLAGMSGSVETEAEEFAKIYRLDTIVIPPNKPVARIDLPDKIFQTERGKFMSLAKEVKKLNEKGQPVLIGTVNIDKSEALSAMLTREGIVHEVLNAKHHEREAEIVSNAGKKASVTIATNMAGRGTDIKISDEVKALGGLAILGTERHESRRIDNQLRGRAGRQGDPGFSQFYVSMDDSLMRRFGGDKMASVMKSLNLPEDDPIENGFISRGVESAQKKIEGFHFDSRKHVVQYDDVMNIHREKIYGKRRIFLGSDMIADDIEEIFKSGVERFVCMQAPTEEFDSSWDLNEVFEIIQSIHISDDPMTISEIESFHHRSDLIENVQNYLLKSWDEKRNMFSAESVDQLSRQIILRSMDELWLEHIDSMTHLRDRVALSGYAQKDPIVEYRRESFDMFKNLLFEIDMTAMQNLFRVNFSQHIEFADVDFDMMQTNSAAVSGESDVKQPSGLSRQQRRAMERKK